MQHFSIIYLLWPTRENALQQPKIFTLGEMCCSFRNSDNSKPGAKIQNKYNSGNVLHKAKTNTSTANTLQIQKRYKVKNTQTLKNCSSLCCCLSFQCQTDATFLHPIHLHFSWHPAPRCPTTELIITQLGFNR